MNEFLSTVLLEVQPAWIVTVERKGTALLRTLVDAVGRGPFPFRIWDRALSHEALDFVNEESLRKGVILLLDDSIYGGNQIEYVISRLTKEKQVPRSNIRVAAFSVHQESSIHPDFHWFAQLEDRTFRAKREAVIEFLQQRGSLLLDTEHVEVSVRLKCGTVEFFEALSTCGLAVEHVSGGGRLNLTIYDPVIFDETSFRRTLPRGTTTDNVVKKIRVVQREDDRYAIIPIFYPSTLSDTGCEALAFLDAPLASLAGKPDKNFHLVGIHAGLHLFTTAFAALKALHDSGKIEVSNPKPGGPDETLSHLKLLFPDIELKELHRTIQERIDSGICRRARGELREPRVLDASPGTSRNRKLKELLWLVFRQAAYYADEVPVEPSGATLAELLQAVRRLDPRKAGHPEGKDEEALLSAAIDQAIDAAALAAGAADMRCSDGKMRKVRLFSLDNELVHADVRKAVAIWRMTPPWDDVKPLET
jgi:hypothetical protein